MEGPATGGLGTTPLRILPSGNDESVAGTGCATAWPQSYPARPQT